MAPKRTRVTGDLVPARSAAHGASVLTERLDRTLFEWEFKDDLLAFNLPGVTKAQP